MQQSAAVISKSKFFGQPRGLSTLFFTEMWERFSYYGMRAILVLFMTSPAAQHGMGLSVETSGAIYGLYTAGVYLLTLPGGWLADNIFGQRRAIWYGGIFIMTGHIILAVPGFLPELKNIFFLGLVFVACGTGMLKPNISTIVGDLYPEGGARRDAGFSLFYMGINIGSLLGQTFVGLLGEKVNWHLGFGLAAIGMFFGLLQFKLTQRSLGDLGIQPQAKEKSELIHPARNKALGWILTIGLVFFLAILQITGLIDITNARGIAETVGIVIISVTVVYFMNILMAGGLTTEEKKRVAIIFMLFIGAAVFWAGFEQAGSSLNLFARDHTYRHILGWEIPASWLQNVNPAFIIILAPAIGALWIKLSAMQLNPNTPLKFGFGLILMALGFLFMYFAARTVITGVQVGMQWLVITYFLHSTGELTLSPVGLSATTKLAPRRYVGQMMGIWFVGAALGNLIAGLYAGEFDPDNLQQMPNVFMSVVITGIGAGLIFILLNRGMRRWMGKIH